MFDYSRRLLHRSSGMYNNRHLLDTLFQEHFAQSASATKQNVEVETIAYKIIYYIHTTVNQLSLTLII